MKTVINIAGKSGSGKSLCADYIKKEHNISLVESYTTRQPRFDGETGHKFITLDEYMKFKEEDKIAYTEFGGNYYCCLLSDLKDINSYVIDEYGINYMKEHFSDKFNIFNVWVDTMDIIRLERLEQAFGKEQAIKRMRRDMGKYGQHDIKYHYNIPNNGNIDQLHIEIDKVIKDITNRLK